MTIEHNYDFITDRLAIGNMASHSTPGFVAVVGRHNRRLAYRATVERRANDESTSCAGRHSDGGAD